MERVETHFGPVVEKKHHLPVFRSLKTLNIQHYRDFSIHGANPTLHRKLRVAGGHNITTDPWITTDGIFVFLRESLVLPNSLLLAQETKPSKPWIRNGLEIFPRFLTGPAPVLP
jgi:hypothetical protein